MISIISKINKNKVEENVFNPLIFEYEQAKVEYNQAMENFNNADPDYINVAIHQLNAMREKMNVLNRKIKKEDLSNEYTSAIHCQ